MLCFLVGGRREDRKALGVTPLPSLCFPYSSRPSFTQPVMQLGLRIYRDNKLLGIITVLMMVTLASQEGTAHDQYLTRSITFSRLCFQCN